MTIHIVKPGVLTTVQDLGRSGYRSLGVNPGGAMDRAAVRLINLLVGNDENAAVIEMHFPAAEIVFETDAVFAMGGANFTGELDGRGIRNWRCIQAKAGSTLRFSDRVKGNRAYLSIAGGLKFDRPLGYPSVRINADSRLEIVKPKRRLSLGENVCVANSLVPVYSRVPTVRVIAGPESYLLTEESFEALFANLFSILPDSDRMGFRLAGKPIPLASKFRMISSAVTFGTIQLLPDGDLIVLMADHQTSGGYPRIGQVASIDLPLIAQLGASDKVLFHRITLEEAEELAMQFERDLIRMKVGVRLRT